jgi:hypothetical protein
MRVERKGVQQQILFLHFASFFHEQFHPFIQTDRGGCIPAAGCCSLANRHTLLVLLLLLQSHSRRLCSNLPLVVEKNPTHIFCKIHFPKMLYCLIKKIS